MKWIPFTLHIKIQPGKWTGLNSPDFHKLRKRMQIWRDMQKIAVNVYDALLHLEPSSIQIATPGSGQHRSYGGTDYAGLSGLVGGCAAVPQFGEKPALLMITGFYNSETLNSSPHENLQRIHAGEVVEGQAKHLYDSSPRPDIDDQVLDLKESVESAIATYAPSVSYAKVFRIDFSGIIYGDRGLHFPVSVS